MWPDGKRTALGPGSVVGGRFAIERAVGNDSLGTLLAARDQKTGRPIALRLLAPGLIATPAAVEILRSAVKTAASIQHKNVVATYGTGTDPSGARFVATEWVDAQTLADLVRENKSNGPPMSLRRACTIIAQVCSALDAAQNARAVHGALRPSAVWVTASGQVKVGGFGTESAIVSVAGPAILGGMEQAYLAPEVKAGRNPDTRSDIFGLGGLLYAMLTGRNAAGEFVAPSAVHPEATSALDEVLLKCLALDPAQRFARPEDVKNALFDLMEPMGDASEVDVAVDVDVDVVPPAAAPTPASKPRVRPPPPPPRKVEINAQVAAHHGVPAQDASAQVPVASAEIDLSALLSKITENDAPRWMVVKDNLDHGPFSGRELVQLVLKGEVLGDHGLLNMDTGRRCKVREAPEFTEFVEQFEIRKADAERKMALERSAKREKLSFVAKATILAAVVGVVGAGVGIFFLTRPDAQEEQHADADLAELYERGEIEIHGTAGILEDPGPGTRRGGRRRAGGARGGMSYEEAMSQVVDLGNVAHSGGSMARLSPQQVAGVMNANINRLLPCVAREPNVGTVRIEMAIAGSGQVLGASVRNGSPAFQSCIASRVRAIRFPSFPAPRMGASYTFSTN